MTRFTPPSRRFVLCPKCEEREFPIEHMFGDEPRDFGPWACDTIGCETAVHGTTYPDGTVDVVVQAPRLTRAFHLLHGNGLWLVVSGYCGPEACDPDYFYREHTCTINVLHTAEEVFTDEGDRDPHGVFKPVGQIFATVENADAIAGAVSLDELFKVFKVKQEPDRSLS